MRSRARRRRSYPRSRLFLTLSRIRRTTAVWALVALAAAVLTGDAAAGLLAEARHERDRWGVVVPVLVVSRAVAAGEVVTRADVRSERWPSALVPDGATPAGRVDGRVALVDLVEGEVVLEERLASSLIPPGWRALAVLPPGAGAVPDVQPGDRVDVLDVAAEGGVTAGEGIVVAAGRDDGAVTVAVPADDAPRVAYAATAGTAVIALSAARPPR